MTDRADRGRKARLVRPPEPPVALRSKFVALTSSSPFVDALANA